MAAAVSQTWPQTANDDADAALSQTWPQTANDDADPPIPAILLQQLHRSTVTAILKDPKALRGSISEGYENASAAERASLVFGQLQHDRREKKRALQKDCLGLWLDKCDTELVTECFWAFRRNVKDMMMERAMLDAAERARLALLRLQQKRAEEKMAANRIANSNRVITEEELKVLGSYVIFLPDSGRSHKTGLFVIGASNSGKAWELSDGSYIKKDEENKLWLWNECEKAKVNIPSQARQSVYKAVAVEETKKDLTQREIGVEEAKRAKGGVMWVFKHSQRGTGIYDRGVRGRPQSARARGLRDVATLLTKSERPDGGLRLLQGPLGDAGLPRTFINITLPRQDVSVGDNPMPRAKPDSPVRMKHVRGLERA